jgi:type IV pilus assembly protein PilB
MSRSKATVKTEAGSNSPLVQDFRQTLQKLLDSGPNGAVWAVDALLSKADELGVSDVHIEPKQNEVEVRFRIDGMLHRAADFSLQHYAKFLGRIKVVARIVTYQKDLPQDGRIDGESNPTNKALRVSTFPTIYGEKVVVRFPQTNLDRLDLDALGFRPSVEHSLRALAAKPTGVFLLTGPASAGKTTTIYSLLKQIYELRGDAVQMVSIEDPVEHPLDFVTQTEVNPYTGFTYDAALRSILRQDPEVIVLGEIRDTETARMAVQAGLTGHLVITTIHSGTAAGVFTRLVNMGIEAHLLTSCVVGVLAQRLLRKNCPQCSRKRLESVPGLLRAYNIEKDTIEVSRGEGCDHCHLLGYVGRTAVGEMLIPGPEIGDLVLRRAQTREIHGAAISSGMVPLAQDALERVYAGDTTLEEVFRVLPPEADDSRRAATD